jgi:hypothetical protein
MRLAALLSLAAAAAAHKEHANATLPPPPPPPPLPATAARFWPGPPPGVADCAAALATQPICEDDAGGVHVFFRGEFGAEFLLALPAAYAAWTQHKLVAMRGCDNAAPLYFFSPNQCVCESTRMCFVRFCVCSRR